MLLKESAAPYFGGSQEKVRFKGAVREGKMCLAYLKCSILLFPLLFLPGRVEMPRFSLSTMLAVGIDWRVVLDSAI